MINRVIRNWLAFVNFEELKEKIGGGRKVYVWGAWQYSFPVAEACSENGICVQSIVKSETEYIDINGDAVEKAEKMVSREDAFVIITVIDGLKNIMEILDNKGFKVGRDYLTIYKEFAIEYRGGWYEDAYGNTISSSDYRTETVKIGIKGYNNHICLGRDIDFGGSKIDCWFGSELNIGSKSRFTENRIWVLEEGKMWIGEGCRFEKRCELISKSELKIGDKCSMQKDGMIYAPFESPITIGNDCMFSSPVQIWSNNGHALIDLTIKENTSIAKKHYVRIGNHVWIGQNVTVLFNAEIGDDVIVGACSLVNKSFPSNCVIAGTPAKVIKENYSWDRSARITYEEFAEKWDIKDDMY